MPERWADGDTPDTPTPTRPPPPRFRRPPEEEGQPVNGRVPVFDASEEAVSNSRRGPTVFDYVPDPNEVSS